MTHQNVSIEMWRKLFRATLKCQWIYSQTGCSCQHWKTFAKRDLWVILPFADRKRLQKTVQLFFHAIEKILLVAQWLIHAKTCLQNVGVTLHFGKCQRVLPRGSNELSTELARAGCNLLDSNCQSKYQCSGGSLQSSHQKNIRFNCSAAVLTLDCWNWQVNITNLSMER